MHTWRSVLGTFLVLSLATHSVSGREWVDVTGKHKVEAEFVRLENGLVHLRKANGKLLKPIPLDKLSPADRQFAEEAAAAADTTATPGDAPAATESPTATPTEAPTGPQTLTWKFTAGQQLPYQAHVVLQFEMMLQQREVKMEMDLTQTLRWTVKEIDTMGIATLACQIDRIVATITPPQGQKVTVDTAETGGASSKGLQAAAIMAPLKQLLGPEFIFKVNNQGKVLETIVPDAIKRSTNAAAQNPAAATGALSDPEQIALLMASQLNFLPPTPVIAGSKWNRPVDIPASGGGRLKGMAKYEFVGWETREGKHLAKIVETDDLKLEPVAPPANAPAGAGQPTMTFSADEISTTYYFDPATGVLAESNGVSRQNLELAYSPTVKTVMKMNLTTETRQGDGATPASAEPAAGETPAETPPAGAGS